ncbi:insulinase family protein [Inconstantimicrobium mannanitabidum]|uniref:Peptidase n=1 Tax=Inconstantimicrobium mannanitabidum TaxID=1604901 RepID=A0ACB5RCQ7_9CLOT|nr:insulinase family protein [Clostridium sp. TW13]GKX66927.1 peptidase [Clostridium sp. TW13]
MDLKVGNSYNGFTLKEERTVKEVAAVAYIFEHDKTKAKLIKLSSKDDNKVFAIGFRTPPNNSTGVAHILEHSVLCGSRKFNTKEPFVELIKGSLNTFLNALTYPDKTIYPIASRNEKDFFNLMDVYLDAVLYPNIYKQEEIFMQEGWNYKLETKEDELKYNGVVYSEMKGAYSSPDGSIYRYIPNVTLPDTQYANDSGGDPECIPDLTYDEFLDFHKKYYHPSNSYIYLYGNGDLEKELKFINDNYLKDFDYRKVDSQILEQKSFTELHEAEFTYGIAKDEDEKEKTYLNLNFLVDKATNTELSYAMEILTHMLLKTSGAPLKKALLDKGIAKAVSGEFDSSIQQTMLSIIAKNSDPDKKDEFKSTIYEVLNELATKGIDKEAIEASVNKVEFTLREADYYGFPKGLVYYTNILESYLYGGDPLAHLQYDAVLDKIKSEMFNGYFENIIKEHLLNNDHVSLITMKPNKGLVEEKEAVLKEKLNKIKQSFKDEELNNIIEKGKRLLERQNTPDSKEQLASIPKLSLEDINPKGETIPTEVRNIEDTKVIYHEFNTNKIVYSNLYFNSKVIAKEKVSYLRLLGDVLGKIDTERYDYVKLSNIVNINIGEVSYLPVAYNDYAKGEEFKAFFAVKFKSLLSNTDKALEIISEILNHTKFSDVKRLKQVVDEVKSRTETMIMQSGHMVAYRRLLSYMSARGLYDEKLYGLSYYKFICELSNKLSENPEAVVKELEEIVSKLFLSDNLLISFAGESEDYETFKNDINKFKLTLKKGKGEENKYDFEVTPLNEGLLTQAEVNYVGKGGMFSRDKYNGSLNVLDTILSYDYLWNNVRVKGGAYGVFSLFRRDGSGAFLSYRDPNVEKTLGVYDNIPAYLDEFKAEREDIIRYIIGTIRKVDHPYSNDDKLNVGDANYLSGITDEMIQKEREEIIATDENAIKQLKVLMQDILDENYICAIGNENKIKSEGNFKQLVRVKE